MSIKILPLATALAMAVSAQAAFAQSSRDATSPGATSGMQMDNAAKSGSGTSAGATAGGSNTMSQTSSVSREKLTKALEDAGFSSVKILDTSYLLSAQTTNGEQVFMYINPPNQSGSAATGSASGSSMSGADTSTSETPAAAPSPGTSPTAK